MKISSFPIRIAAQPPLVNVHNLNRSTLSVVRAVIARLKTLHILITGHDLGSHKRKRDPRGLKKTTPRLSIRCT